ncbi:MAG: hypothetical protein JO317_03885 [Verrucomicrobiae bacterium]|nr:hypothetical protein [Verrucomicrobiae bacterium]
MRFLRTFVVVSGVLMAIAGLADWRTVRLQVSGQPAEARVLRQEHRIAQASAHPESDLPSREGYWISYELEAAGARVPGEGWVELAVFEAAQKTGKLAVRYLPKDPTINAPAASEGGWWRGLPAIAAGAVLFAAGYWALPRGGGLR